MPKLHFLTAKAPLAEQVAEWLLAGETSDSTLLITPTARAGASVANTIKLAGKKPPRTAQPMQALLPESGTIANPVERCLAWASALNDLNPSAQRALFWNRFPESTTERLKAARNFNQLCDRLAEAGLDPNSLTLPENETGYADDARWSAISTLFDHYSARLESWGLEDPNALRINHILSSSEAPKRLVVAAVPDLPRAFERYVEKIESIGSQVDLLVWNPRNEPTYAFDAWGRPEPEIWSEHALPVQPAQIHVAPSTQDEARKALKAFDHESPEIVVVDPKLRSAIASEALFKGFKPYLPEGKNLRHSQAAKIVLEWEAFRETKDLRTLRRLLELPAFCRALDTENPLSQTDALLAVDHLLGKSIASTLDSAWAASPQLPEGPSGHADPQTRAKVRRLLGLIQTHLESSAPSLIETAYPETAENRPQSVERVLEIAHQLQSSPAVQAWLANRKKGSPVPAQFYNQAIRNEAILEPKSSDAIVLNGWLEAPWLSAEKLILCGLVEGQLPQAVDGDPFLPDSICSLLGLSHNQQRLARDAYLLDALVASRAEHNICLSFSKFSSDGDPNRPSRLLFRTPLGQLPERVQHLTKSDGSDRLRPTRKTKWLWKLPTSLPAIDRISPTQFEAYLSCPFRYCLRHVLRVDSGPVASHEMDAAVFGNLIHKTLEDFSNEAIRLGDAMLNMDAATIYQRTQSLLETEADSLFGTEKAPAVQIQIANASARLHAFARVQAEAFAEGWLILSAERRLRPDDPNPLKIGPLFLSGIIDRIEKNVRTNGLRITDYKTFSSPLKPAQTHLAPASHNWLEAALIELPSFQRAAQKTWKNLQLPLYRRILEHWYPKECDQHPPETAYFLLPSDPNESAIATFEELDESINPDAYESALKCAEIVAQHIHDGHFWPPQPFRENWDDIAGPIFKNGAPEECVDPETIQLLKGAHS